jgi:Pyruvate/2-oxoacid:ferredoxin oxidoreductase delta subunit
LEQAMAHHTTKQGYISLSERLNKFPLGSPATKSLYKVLELLFSPKEAQLVALLPVKPFDVQTAANIWKLGESEARKILDSLASKAILVDIEFDGKPSYALPPPMAGFFEFALMRTRNDIDQKLLSQLLHQYLDVEDDFVKALFREETQMGRTFVNEDSLSQENALHVLDFERATHTIESAKFIGVSTCYCRHKKHHTGGACDAPLEVCMTFSETAKSLSKHGYARAIDKVEGLELLAKAKEHNLVQFGENAQEDVSFLCNCCGCCCEALQAARNFAYLNPVHTTNFLPHINEESCSGCSKCVEVCPVEAMSLVSANNPQKPKKKIAKLDTDRCLGCGVCVQVCQNSSLLLKSIEKRVLTPVNSAHKIVSMAIERGTLQHLIFDNQALWNHRVMATILGVILKLPPIKQALASEQIKSRYLGKLLANTN